MKYFEESGAIIESLCCNAEIINRMAMGIYNCQLSDGKLLIAGIGGSCATAEHFAGEMTCTFNRCDREGFSAISLSNNSALTAWVNDFDFDSYFRRQVEAHGKKGDILFLISVGGGDTATGVSMSLVSAAVKAKAMGLKIYSIVGIKRGELSKISDECIVVKSAVGSYVQEAHLAIIHAIVKELDELSHF